MTWKRQIIRVISIETHVMQHLLRAHMKETTLLSAHINETDFLIHLIEHHSSHKRRYEQDSSTLLRVSRNTKKESITEWTK